MMYKSGMCFLFVLLFEGICCHDDNLFKKTATKTLCTNTKQSFYLQSAVMKSSGKGSKLIVQNAVMKFRKGKKRTFRDREIHQHLIIF